MIRKAIVIAIASTALVLVGCGMMGSSSSTMPSTMPSTMMSH